MSTNNDIDIICGNEELQSDMNLSEADVAGDYLRETNVRW